MPIEILMPALSPTMTEGNLVRWLKKEGDDVASGEVLAEIETDKATMEVEAVDEGKLGKILIEAGAEGVKVNTPIAILLEEGEDASDIKLVKSEAAPKAAPQKTEAPKAAVAPSQAIHSGSDRIVASPLAKRMAEHNKLELSVISGSGPKGRIVKKDVESALSSGGAATAAARPQFMPVASPQLSGFEPEYDVIDVSNMRKVIASRLQESKQVVPHFYLTIDCEIDELLAARARINEKARGKYKLSVNDIIIKACAMALRQVPEANASWIDGKVLQYRSADISVAVAIEGGLITPVVREADSKGLAEISEEMKSLAQRARDNQLKPQEFQGGTFTISNLGMYGIKDFSAIINPPQGCIMAIGAGEQRPIVKGGKLEIATMMTCTLSVDHRVVDGAVGANFLAAFKACIEDPLSMVL